MFLAHLPRNFILTTSSPLPESDQPKPYFPLSTEPKITSTLFGESGTIETKPPETLFPEVIELEFLELDNLLPKVVELEEPRPSLPGLSPSLPLS